MPARFSLFEITCFLDLAHTSSVNSVSPERVVLRTSWTSRDGVLSEYLMRAKCMVHSTIRMVMPPEKRGEAVKILRAVVEQNRVQAGCLSSRIYEDVDQRNTFMFEEMWRNEEDLRRNLQSEEYPKVLLVVEMALERPEITFNVISNTSGIETVEEARGLRRTIGL
jgi:quinol monooxygenase YgiN